MIVIGLPSVHQRSRKRNAFINALPKTQRDISSLEAEDAEAAPVSRRQSSVRAEARAPVEARMAGPRWRAAREGELPSSPPSGAAPIR
jgi:hypothetical protein